MKLSHRIARLENSSKSRIESAEEMPGLCGTLITTIAVVFGGYGQPGSASVYPNRASDYFFSGLGFEGKNTQDPPPEEELHQRYKTAISIILEHYAPETSDKLRAIHAFSRALYAYGCDLADIYKFRDLRDWSAAEGVSWVHLVEDAKRWLIEYPNAAAEMPAPPWSKSHNEQFSEASEHHE